MKRREVSSSDRAALQRASCGGARRPRAMGLEPADAEERRSSEPPRTERAFARSVSSSAARMDGCGRFSRGES